MFASSIIIFREMLEIVLIVGIVLAATRKIPDRTKWVLAGFAGGLLGSVVVAMFTNQISSFAEGMGQEFFNAGILFMAAFFIGWTVLWMSQHGRHMKAHFAQMGEQVVIGQASMITLSVAIALAIWREGSEIVLFSYGMLAAGQAVSSLLLGALIGGSAGLVIGLLIYFGLLALPAKYFLRVTSALLIVLVAGMVSQGTHFLIAAGIIEHMTATAWDSSWLVQDQGVFGQMLHALTGYTSRPAQIQVLVFILTVGVLFGLLRFNNTRYTGGRLQVRPLVLVLASVSMLAGLVFASNAMAAKQVYTPYIEQGELEAEWKGTYAFDDNKNVDDKQEHIFAVGYGITDRWFSEVLVELEKSGVSGSDFETTALEWENRFQFFEPGEKWLDLGLYTAYKVSLEDNGADKAEVKLLLGKDTGKFSHYVNLVLEKEVGANATEGTEAGINWSTIYRYQPWLKPGIELYSDFGELKASKPYREQKHQLGPVIHGDLPGGIGYELGYLFGISDAANDGELKWLLEYEIHF
ncbi:MAG: FTR1 family protein [Hyphomicrobiales bacterium]|nr:FTR1 family protein [Hyphomicrobiales bacterium]